LVSLEFEQVKESGVGPPSLVRGAAAVWQSQVNDWNSFGMEYAKEPFERKLESRVHQRTSVQEGPLVTLARTVNCKERQ